MHMQPSNPLALLAAATLVSPLCHAQSTSSPAILSELLVQDYALKEEKPDGANGEPSWVRERRFSNTRVYIQKDPWEMGVEQWYRARFYDGGHVTQRSQQEIELGLPYRMQLDLYEKMLHDNEVGKWQQEEVAVELRYAFADWKAIPGNPTIYLEYAFAHEGSDVFETKLLFGDDFHGWHWGVNLINEHELWGAETNEWAVSCGLSRTIIDDKLSLGVETQWTHADDSKSELILGPSVQWLPTDNTHLDLVAMGGLTDSSPNAECWLIFGFDFGAGTKTKGYKPVTVGGH